MIRTFHPVGQGAFYTEDFGDFKIVYDCGSSTDEKTIENSIKTTFDEKQVIDAVFISHLHKDHVNGLEFLLNHCDIRKLFLPLLSPIEKNNIFIQNYILGFQSLFIERLILEDIVPIQQEFENLEIIYIPEITEDDSLQNLEFQEISIDNSIKNQGNFNNPKFTSTKTEKWVFLPFNFRYKQRSGELARYFNNKNNIVNHICIDNIDDFKKHWENTNDKKKIIDAYKTIPGSMNTNSMTLYSGPEVKNNSEFYMSLLHPCYRLNYCCKMNIVGCLYFGDYEASGKIKWNQFIKFYRDYWNNVGTVQIPHHGSRHNYHLEINLFPKFSIISAGYKNQYHHPHSSTIKQILFYGGIPLIVNEYPGSFIVFEINTYHQSYIRRLKLRQIYKPIDIETQKNS